MAFTILIYQNVYKMPAINIYSDTNGTPQDKVPRGTPTFYNHKKEKILQMRFSDIACHTPLLQKKGKDLCHYPFSVPSNLEFRD